MNEQNKSMETEEQTKKRKENEELAAILFGSLDNGLPFRKNDKVEIQVVKFAEKE